MISLAYCDYIADKIQKGLRDESYREESLLHYVDKIEWDLHPEGGYLLTTKKTIDVQDVNCKRYRITIEELDTTPSDEVDVIAGEIVQ